MTSSTPTYRSRSSSLSSIKSVASTALSYLIPSRRSSTQSRSKPDLPSIDTSFSPRIKLKPSDKTSTDVRFSQSKIPNFSRHLNRHHSGYAPGTGSTTATSTTSTDNAPINVLYEGEEKSAGSYSTSSSSRPSLSLNALAPMGVWKGEEDDQEEWRHTPTPRTSSDRWAADDDEEDYDNREEESNDPPPNTFIGNTGRERSYTTFSLFSQHSDDSTSSNGKPRRSLNRRSLDALSSLNSHLLPRRTPQVRRLPERNRSWLGEDDLPEPLRIYPPVNEFSLSDEVESSSEPYDDHSVSPKRIDYIQDPSQDPDDGPVETDFLEILFKSDIFSGGNGRRRSMISSIMDILSGNTPKTSFSNVANDRPRIEPDDVDGSSVGIRPLSRTSSGISTATTRLRRIKGDLLELFSGLTKSSHRINDSNMRERTGDRGG